MAFTKIDYVLDKKDRWIVFVGGKNPPKRKHKSLEKAETEAIRLAALTGRITWVCKLESGFLCPFEKPKEILGY